jgi:hypothetical protein
MSSRAWHLDCSNETHMSHAGITGMRCAATPDNEDFHRSLWGSRMTLPSLAGPVSLSSLAEWYSERKARDGTQGNSGTRARL